MARTRITVDVDPEVRRRVQLAVADRNETIRDFVERAILRELEEESWGEGEELDGEEELILPPTGVKPRGSKNPPRLRGGGTMAEAVVEDRR